LAIIHHKNCDRRRLSHGEFGIKHQIHFEEAFQMKFSKHWIAAIAAVMTVAMSTPSSFVATEGKRIFEIDITGKWVDAEPLQVVNIHPASSSLPARLASEVEFGELPILRIRLFGGEPESPPTAQENGRSISTASVVPSAILWVLNGLWIFTTLME
jgi:hypothetical protein